MSTIDITLMHLPGLRPLSLESCIILSAAVTVFYLANSYFVNPLSRIPSIHWSAPLSRAWYTYSLFTGPRTHMHLKAHRNLGGDAFQPVIRIGPNEVSVMASAAIKTIYESGNFNRTNWYEAFMKWGQHIMFTFQSGQDHQNRRRIYMKNYNRTAIFGAHCQHIIRSRSTKLLNFLLNQTSKESPTTRPFLARNLCRALQLDVVTAFTFSDTDGTKFLDRLDSSLYNTVEEVGLEVIDLFYDERNGSYLFWEIESPFKYLINFFSKISRESKAAHRRAESWTSGLISQFEARYRNCKDETERQRLVESSIYGKMLIHQPSNGSEQLRWEKRAAEILDHVGAGQENLPAVLDFVIRQLCIYPDVQEAIREELKTLPAGIEASAYADIEKLPYLNAVILESLRIVTVVESYQPRFVPKGGCTIEGYYLPAGTIVSSQPYLIHRQENIFPEPESFLPGRWLIEDKEKKRALMKSMWAFSSGPRGCIGKDLSMATMKIAIGYIYSHFSTQLMSEKRPKRPWEAGYAMNEVTFTSLH
ncbi:MAG: hypothetical protein MMC33_006838 [Icmadophila ericetorum]|nr:hypothetical protein [Icmadophila ericetorum]